jgi:hypothetical protein
MEAAAYCLAVLVRLSAEYSVTPEPAAKVIWPEPAWIKSMRSPALLIVFETVMVIAEPVERMVELMSPETVV